MSCSRWSNSLWYTFYACSYSVEKDEQLFEICSLKVFSYKELKGDIDKCIKVVREKMNEATEIELQELKGYMNEFIDDVESNIALGLVQQIKNAGLKEVPDLIEKLRQQIEKHYDKDIYEEFLRSIA